MSSHGREGFRPGSARRQSAVYQKYLWQRAGDLSVRLLRGQCQHQDAAEPDPGRGRRGGERALSDRQRADGVCVLPGEPDADRHQQRRHGTGVQHQHGVRRGAGAAGGV